MSTQVSTPAAGAATATISASSGASASNAGAAQSAEATGKAAGTAGAAATGNTSLLDGNPSGAQAQGKPNQGGSLLEEGDAGEGQKKEGTDPGKDPTKSTPDGKKEGTPQSQAPEKYEEFKLPEGMKLDPGMLEQFQSAAKEAGLSQAAAQKLVDLQAKFAQAQQQTTLAQYQQTQDAWKQESIHALGPEYKKELAFASKTLERFGTPELKQLFIDSGLGNHKEVLSLLIKAGRAISEDSFAGGKQSAPAAKTAAQVLYPNHS